MKRQHLCVLVVLMGGLFFLLGEALAEKEPAPPAAVPATQPAASAPTGNTPPREMTLDLGRGGRLELVLIPAGAFLMGSPEEEKDRHRDEGPQHKVTMARPYYMGKYHVTVAQFRRFVEDTGYQTEAEKAGDASAVDWSTGNWGLVKGITWKNPGFPQEDSHPVVCVTWNDALAFCEWAGRKTARKITLPSEAQWEYVARAGEGRMFPWGQAWPPPSDAGNYADQSLAEATRQRTGKPWTVIEGYRDGYAFTSSAGSFRANPFGVCDIGGNVWQWCKDVYDEGYASAPTDGTAREGNSSERVLRGSGWNYYNPDFMRSAYRGRFAHDSRSINLGFRVMMDSPANP